MTWVDPAGDGGVEPVTEPPRDGGPSADAAIQADAGVQVGDPAKEDGSVAPSDARVDAPTISVQGDAVGSACLRTGAMTIANQTHVIGVYESTGGQPLSHGPGPIDVHVTTAASPATLFLSSYEPVTWRVALDPGASVAAVFVQTYYPAQTTVEGLAASVPITAVTGSPGYAYGWEATAQQGGGSFTRTIAAARTAFGGLETTFQGAYSSGAFTVPPPLNALHSHYDNTKACTDACGLPAGTLALEVVSPGTKATASGLSANVTTSTWGAGLRGTRGARCGRHYFEVESTGGKATVSVMIEGIGWVPSLSVYVPTQSVANGRIGVALDLDDATIAFVTPQGAGSPQKLPIWDHEELVPAVDLASATAGVVTLVTRPPFAFTPPTGFVGDL